MVFISFKMADNELTFCVTDVHGQTDARFLVTIDSNSWQDCECYRNYPPDHDQDACAPHRHSLIKMNSEMNCIPKYDI